MDEELMQVEQRWDITYRHAIGRVATEFLLGLKEKRLRGRLCPQCRRVIMPPRSYCDRCHADTTEWVDIATEGVIEGATIVYQKFQGLPEPPYALAYVTLIGADTAMLNYLKGVDLSDPGQAAAKMAIGSSVRVRFLDRPEGKMTDFWYELSDQVGDVSQR